MALQLWYHNRAQKQVAALFILVKVAADWRNYSPFLLNHAVTRTSSYQLVIACKMQHLSAMAGPIVHI